MLHVIFTLDYEIHGNGEGSPRSLMLEPTERLMRLFEEYGAKVTIMADVAEILKFKEYKERVGRDDYCYAAIVDQLRSALSKGHDVQLHIHSSYFNANYAKGRWEQDWSEYNFAGLPLHRMICMVKRGKKFLESILRPVDQTYRCIAFRAANWSVSPSRNVVTALVENDIPIDSSIFKGGQREGMVCFDYSHAYHHVRPWPVNPTDICQKASGSPVWEFPIYAEMRYLGAFLSVNRLHRVLNSAVHRMPAPDYTKRSRGKTICSAISRLRWLLQKHAWKADFNQCSGRQLIRALLRAEKQAAKSEHVPFVLIGHSKLFTSWNERTLRLFLNFISAYEKRFNFATLTYLAWQFGLRNSNSNTASSAYHS